MYCTQEWDHSRHIPGASYIPALNDTYFLADDFDILQSPEDCARRCKWHQMLYGYEEDCVAYSWRKTNGYIENGAGRCFLLQHNGTLTENHNFISGQCWCNLLFLVFIFTGSRSTIERVVLNLLS